MLQAKYNINYPQITGRNVPIAEIAKAIGKDAQYIRIGIQQGIQNLEQQLKLGIQENIVIIVLIRRYGKRQDTLIKIFDNIFDTH